MAASVQARKHFWNFQSNVWILFQASSNFAYWWENNCQEITGVVHLVYVEIGLYRSIEFEIEVSALCDSQTGCFLKIQVYKGEKNNSSGKGLAERAVMDHMKNYVG